MRVGDARETGLSAAEAQDRVNLIRDAVEKNRGALVSPDFRAVLNAFAELDTSLVTGHEHPTDWA
jgi:hypothetical protein